jgi:outer membrane protein TolC
MNRSKLLVAVAFILGMAVIFPNSANAAPEEVALSLRQVIDIAVQNNPAVIESQKRWEAKKTRIAVAKAQPNPELGIMQDDIPTRTLNPFKAMMTEIELSQEIMNPAKLKAMAKMAASDAEMAKADWHNKQMEIYTGVKQAYYDLLYADKAVEIMQQNQELMGQLLSLAQVNYSNGFAPLQDTLRAQTEFSKMGTDLLNMAAMAAVARTKVNALMGRPVDAVLNVNEEFNTPPPDFDLAELQEEAQKRKPSILSMEWGTKMAQDGIAMAKKQGLPDFKISLGYKTTKMETTTNASGGDGGEDMDGDMGNMGRVRALSEEMTGSGGSRKDTWKISLMIMLPLWTGQTRAEIRAASADAEAAQASLADMRNMAGMDLLMALSETQSFWRQINLYQNTVIPQAEQSYQAGVVSYTNGQVDFMAVLDSLTTLGNARLDHYKARVDYEKSVASLENAVGRPFFENEIRN